MDVCERGDEGGLGGQVYTVQHVRSCAAVTIAALLLARTLLDKDLLFVSAATFIIFTVFFLHSSLVHFIIMSRVAQDPPPQLLIISLTG